jgi:hypothetical protein
MAGEMKGNRGLWLAWWYACTSLGFALLAFYRLLLHDDATQIGVRLLLAVPFGLLAVMEFRHNARRRPWD